MPELNNMINYTALINQHIYKIENLRHDLLLGMILLQSLKVVDPGYVQMSHGLGPMEKLRVTERVHWKRTVIVRWGCWWKLYGNLWAVSGLCLEAIGTEPRSSDTK
ncbi:hypothetical protein BY996DRAFT_6426315 [Phakopsora pachyrhizi]|nr:hypothetical protein BY996DRAFT_6426315 [Phakopsora pachyrhizi]